eukprot:CAMPEP_0114235950 /NCGR_PEP_ID=MMETSP0058-20121206/6541_1 /TAXON_ID=36894 /ORGANISM="Pyramimonas parkeae, CCMP726" /LENGTH=175 /DNA_ID=CAMNT_0001347781 /DNA_START=82 /DNA_END=609 /DNA_ORIENTATION=-
MPHSQGVRVKSRIGMVHTNPNRYLKRSNAIVSHPRKPSRSRLKSKPCATANNADEGTSWFVEMGFKGFLPETVNGRSAQVGLLAGLGAEIVTGESIPAQMFEHPMAFAAVVGVITAASLVPSSRENAKYGSNPKSLGDIGLFTAEAETANGRAAMLGIGFMMVYETVSGHSLFNF